MDTRKYIDVTTNPFQAITSPETLGFNQVVFGGRKASVEIITEVAVISAPEDEAVLTATTTTVTWSSVDGAATYEIQIASDSDFETIFETDDEIETESYEVTGPFIDEATYYVRVRPMSSQGIHGAWSGMVTFSINLA